MACPTWPWSPVRGAAPCSWQQRALQPLPGHRSRAVSLWFRVRSAGFSLRQGTVPVLCLRHTRRGSNDTAACASSGLQVQRRRSALRCFPPRAPAPLTRSSAAARTAVLSCTPATLAPECVLSRRPGSTAGGFALQQRYRWHGPPCPVLERGAQALWLRRVRVQGSLTLADWNHESHLHREAHDTCTASAICLHTHTHRERERERGGVNRGRGVVTAAWTAAGPRALLPKDTRHEPK